MRRSTATVLSIGAVTTALAVGGSYSPGPKRPMTSAWYATLRKPGFVPPGPVFGIAWSLLGVALMYSGYRLMTAAPAPRRQHALVGWALSVASIAAWPWVFFGRKQLRASVALSAAMCVTALSYVRDAAKVDFRAAVAGMPFVGWLFFALAMDEEVSRRNTGALDSLGDAVRRPVIAATARLSRG